MYNIILRNFYKQAEPSLQVVIALAKVGSTFLDREKTLHIYFLKSQSSTYLSYVFPLVFSSSNICGLFCKMESNNLHY